MSDVTEEQIEAVTTGSPWTRLGGVLAAHFDTRDFAAGVELVRRIGEAADTVNHHPDVDLRYGYVVVILMSHDVQAVTSRDLALAEQITVIARELGADPAAGVPGQVCVAVDALDIPAIRPFWKAALGYADLGGDEGDLVDPRGRGPLVWFQQMDVPRTDRNRLHLDVLVSSEEVAGRLAAVEAAGGRVVSVESAPRFWVVADVEGNEVCLCT